MPIGEPLPTEKELVELLNVSRTTVRAALTELEEAGTIRSNESRRRVPVKARVDQSGSMVANAVIILSDPSREGHKQTGYNFFIEMSLSTSLRRSGYNVLSLKSAELEEDALRQLQRTPPRGVVVLRDALSSISEKVMSSLLRVPAPVVVYGHGEQFAEFDTVASDHASGAAELTRWLIKRGRKHILPVWHRDLNSPQPLTWFAAREAGYRSAMQEAGLTALEPLVIWSTPVKSPSAERFESESRLAAGYIAKYVTSKPAIDAVMTLSDDRIFCLSEACRQFGLKPNTSIDIVGYDNYWMDYPDRAYTDFTPLVSVDKQNLLIGEKLSELMQQRIESAALPKPQHILVAPRLVNFDKGLPVATSSRAASAASV